MPYTDTYPFIHPSRFTHLLTGQSALVTGASRGIGPSIALAVADVVLLAPALDLVAASLNATLLSVGRAFPSPPTSSSPPPSPPPSPAPAPSSRARPSTSPSATPACRAYLLMLGCRT